MALTNFRSYQLSLKFYYLCEELRCSRVLRDQLTRAASSITLNLAEGSAKPTRRDRARFYYIALGSLRECQAVFELSRVSRESEIWRVSDELGGHLYQLTKNHGGFDADVARSAKRESASPVLPSDYKIETNEP